MKKLFLGIDPGKEGFFVVIDDNGHIVERIGIPQIGSEYNKKAIKDFIELFNFQHIVLESPGIIQGASKSSVASLQKCVSLIEGILFCSGIPHTLVKPKEWQSVMWKNVTKQYKTSTQKKQVDTKATSLLAATNLFPTTDFKITAKLGQSKNYNDNYVDATLIAEYGRRMYVNGII